MSKKTDNDEFIETNDTLMGVLRKLDDGAFANVAGAEVQTLFNKLRALVENKNGVVKGTVTLTLSIDMGAGGVAMVKPTIKTKAPEFSRRPSVVFIDEDGDLISRPAEKQQSLFLASGAASPAAAKDPAQPAVKGL